MKWYSLKKYKLAPLDSYVFVRNIAGIWVAKLESQDTWIDQDGRYFEDDYAPTHFCIPDPIEAEE